MAAIVYLGKSGSKNFASALDNGVWGCRVDQQWGQQEWSLSVGDPVLFISFVKGGRRDKATWNTRSAEGCWLATVSEGWHKNQDNIWGRNPLYEFRFNFEGALEIGTRSLRSLGAAVYGAAWKALTDNFIADVGGIQVQSLRNVQYVANEVFLGQLSKGLQTPPPNPTGSKKAPKKSGWKFSHGRRHEQESRPEQGALRDLLLTTYGEQCALCHRELEKQFLVAAHIKKRSECNVSEKNDIGNIGMLACTLGCDAAYEQGLITVSEKGRIVKNPSKLDSFPSASKAFKVPSNNKVKVWQNSHTHEYFKWHRTKGAGAG